ncbi:MAG: hypothetical protein R8K50_05020 [Mariprofundus sp.]
MKVTWQPKAIKQVRNLGDRKLRQRISSKVDELELIDRMDECASVKMLTNHAYDCRMRVGDWRILINLIDECPIIACIEEVKKRDEHTY